MEFLVSSPGKVILFGEHAVVHGIPAIAASIGLRTYLSVSPSSDPDIVELDFPDVGLAARWSRSLLPHFSVSDIPTSIDTGVYSKLLPSVEAATANPFEQAAARAFLYLWGHLCSTDTPGYCFTVRSSLPIGAGLGSSASLSVSLAAALLVIGAHIPLSGSPEALEIIDKWSFLGECCIHGRPSGIDNVVATYGGTVNFRRNAGTSPTVVPYGVLPQMRLILTDTRVPRLTTELVSRVSQMQIEWPTVFDPLMASIAAVSSSASTILTGTMPSDELEKLLGELMAINHGVLVALGVSHPSLERVRETADELNVGPTKLTGAGGGGCAITLAKSNANMAEFKKRLGEPYHVFETTLGGPGVMFVTGAAASTDLAELEAMTWEKF